MKYKYLASFVRRSFYNDFCLGELMGLTETLGKKLYFDESYSFDPKYDPLIKIHIDGIEDTDIAEKICERAILTNYIIKVKILFLNFLIYSEAETFEDLVKNVNREEFKEEIESEKTFKMFVDARGRVASQENKLELINMFGVLNFKGKINLKNPDRTFVIVDNYYKGKKYFGRLIAGKSDDALYYSKYNLPGRKYLGPTTTDNILAFVMCNLGRVKANDCILDPFVGTGSLLIPPTHFGAITYGSDIDIRVLKGYGIGYTKKYTYNYKVNKYNCDDNKFNKGDVDYSEKSNIFTNFVNYDLPFPQIIRSDINNHNIRHCEFFDAIVCDPPYGQRAFTRKTGLETNRKEKRQKRLKEKYANYVDKIKQEGSTSQEQIEEKLNEEIQAEINKEINENEEIEDDEEENEIVNEDEFIKNVNDNTHGENKENSSKWAQLKHCPLDQIFKNLMEISNRCIKKGGYMVCLYPVNKKKEEADLIHQPVNFPRHENFNLLEAIENRCTPLKSRWCLVYKKKE